MKQLYSPFTVWSRQRYSFQHSRGTHATEADEGRGRAVRAFCQCLSARC